MLKLLKWAGLAAAVLLVITCFMPWVVIESRHIIITGTKAPGTNYGSPGYFNLLMTALFIVGTFIPRVWAKRMNLAIVAMNLAWTIRNYFLLTRCEAGECPTKQAGIYLLLIASSLMLVSALFPDITLKKTNLNDESHRQPR